MRGTWLVMIAIAMGLAVPSFALGTTAGADELAASPPRSFSTAPPPAPQELSRKSTTAATLQWSDGGIVSHAYYRGCFPEFWFDFFVSSYTGHVIASDLSYPKVGDVYYMHLVSAVAELSSCAGGADHHTEVILPDHTNFAVSLANPVRCWYTSPISGLRSDVTHDPAAGCPTNPATRGFGSYGRDMGTRIIANGGWFEIEFPVVTTQPLRGMASSGTSAQLVMPTQVTLAANDWTAPFQWVNVLSTSTPNPYISYPTPSAAQITETDAKTTGYLFSYSRTGNARIQLGPAPGTWTHDTGPIAIPAGQAWEVWANQWGGGANGSLTPGKKYYWRLCFDETGPTSEFCGRTQSFTTRDSVPPVVSLTAPGANAYVGRTVNLKANAVDAEVAEVEFLVDGAVVGTDSTAPYSVPWNSKLKPDGPVTIRARATDASNNVGQSGLRTIVVDNTKPNTKLKSGPSVTVSSGKATFKFVSTEPAGAKFQCKLDSGGWKSCKSPKTYKGIGRGQHTFQVRAIDRAGNVDPTPAKRSWRRS